MISRPLALASAALLTLSAGAFVAATAAAAPTTTSVTLKATGTELSRTQYTSTQTAEADVLRKPTLPREPLGTKLGYATESCRPTKASVGCAVAFTLRGGVLFGHYVFSTASGTAGNTAIGRITGGLGRYQGATGKIELVTSQDLSSSTPKGSWVLKFSIP